MGLLDLFRNKTPEGDSREFSKICYSIAYGAIPKIILRRDDFFKAWKERPEQFRIALCSMAYNNANTVVNPRLSKLIIMHSGSLDDHREYYILEYPKPPDFDRTANPPILAPFFSAIVRNADDDTTKCYALGQSTDGNTTFRVVDENGHGNAGMGPEPQLALWIDHLRRKG